MLANVVSFDSRIPVKAVYGGFNWFVLRVQGAREEKAALNLELCGASGLIPDYCLVNRLWVPFTTVVYLRKGVQKEKKVVLTPGYIFMKAILSPALHAALATPDIPYVFGWLRRGSRWPSLVPLNEIRALACLEMPMEKVTEPDPVFVIGDKVLVPSMGIEGKVVECTYAGLTLECSIFKHPVPFKVEKRHFKELVRLDA